jgi:3-deoxy-D-manno-oct-2-ulosonic acid (Kdo) hydroxylase
MVEQTRPATPAGQSIEERLEQCEVIYFPRAPFALPEGDDRSFLLHQVLGAAAKNISYTPSSERLQGFQRRSAADTGRLRELLAGFSRSVTGWLAQACPHYAQGWRLDQVSYRPVEEATRQLRLKARNDLLHVDAFPSRPTHGQRILRCFANINPSEPRIWVTSEAFAPLLARYGREVGLPGKSPLGWGRRACELVLRIARPGWRGRTAYDVFMLRFHDFLKANEAFQEKCRKRCWAFPPGSAWLVFTDAVTHAALRGRFALEHSYFVRPEALLWPQRSPAALLERACGTPVLRAA